MNHELTNCGHWLTSSPIRHKSGLSFPLELLPCLCPIYALSPVLNVNTRYLFLLIPHQANIRIIQATARKLDMPMERVIVTIDEHGNTSAASIPLALDVAIRDGRIRSGDNVLMEAFGGGFTWGAVLITF